MKSKKWCMRTLFCFITGQYWPVNKFCGVTKEFYWLRKPAYSDQMPELLQGAVASGDIQEDLCASSMNGSVECHPQKMG